MSELRDKVALSLFETYSGAQSDKQVFNQADGIIQLVKEAVKEKVREAPVRRALGAAYQDDLIMIDKAIKAIDEV